MEYRIRACAQNDLPVIIDLCERHAAFEQASYSRAGKLEALSRVLFVESPQLHCYVVEVDEKVGGYFTFTFDFSTWDAQRFLYLDCLFLDHEYRSLGIGAEVFSILSKIAAENQCANIQWQTPVFNERAIQFYNRMGGERRDKARFTLALKHVMTR